MATDDKRRLFLAVNNSTKPSGDAFIPPKGSRLHLARPDEVAEVKKVNEAMRLAPGLHSLATKINGNFLLQRILTAAIEKANANLLDDEDDFDEGDIK